MMTEFIWGVRVWLKEYTRSEKKTKFKKRNFFLFTWALGGDLTSIISEWDLCRCKSRKKREKIEKKFFFYLLYLREWTRLSSSEISMDAKAKKKKNLQSEKNFQSWKNLKHCIYFETLYLFWGIVFISRHCIHFKTLYKFRDNVLISRHCINFETLY